jgi:DNA processing protein
MALDKELEPWLRLSLLPGLGHASFRQLLTAFGSPEQVLGASHDALRKLVAPQLASAICNGGVNAGLSAIAAWLDGPVNHVVTLADAAYPRSLLEIPDPPVVLYVTGRLDLLNKPALAIVGSRHATPQGVATAKAFATALSDCGLTIASGMALGIDAAAHRGGLAGSARSLAIVATGLDIVYPARNRDLAHALAEAGALVSEFALGTPAIGANFPRRNRLISGIARGCLVVEAALNSGSLITARLANEQSREVFAVPGSIHSPLSKGCHLLIKQGAKLVESAQDVLEELGLPGAAAQPGPLLTQARREARALLDHLGFDPCDIDTLAARCGLASEQVAALLTELEIDGLVTPLPGGKYQRRP